MKGSILIIRSYQERAPIPRIDLKKPPETDLLQSIVRGWLELIPGFDTILWDHKVIRCVAFCNEEGKLKNLPFNGSATMMWHIALQRARGLQLFTDHLVGDIAVVFGNDEFMKKL